jgi:hypothetical protein
MKNSGKRQGELPLHVKVQVQMLEKGIKRALIMQRLNMSKSLLSKALRGKRHAALHRVARFVGALKRR